MTEQEINHAIATQVRGWIHDEGIFYHDAAGFTCYLSDYCNSIAHALDLAKEQGVGLAPTPDGWQAYQLSNPEVLGNNAVAAKAICLCILTIHGVSYE
jgi:hypothetical protein